MRHCGLLVALASLVISCYAQDHPEGPANEKAQKTYKEGLEYLQQHKTLAALDSFKKADKQDDGKCQECQRQMVKYGLELGDWKTAETAGEEMVAEAEGARNIALAHYQLGFTLLNEGLERHKEELFQRAHDEMTKALAAAPNFPDAVFGDGRVLAHMNKDEEAKARFEQFVKMKPAGDPIRERAVRFISEPELARARMAPAFSIVTTEGQRISIDELKGRVVLMDFWATWCGPCRAALPHIREIAKKFQGQPLVVLSINLDDDQQKWKAFIAKNEMTWPQYGGDGGFKGPMATLFGVREIPQTFTIDADGILQDQHIGDASIEGKIKKLVSRARDLQAAETAKQ
ncbi:MAG TPA: redoxin domain-containing protein [Terriglobales bacterium]|nr:redoxin domain-containing protein [Terriglobales bacterium]